MGKGNNEGEIGDMRMEEGLLNELHGALPPYALPATIDCLDALPRTPTGKLDRKKMAARYEAGEHTDV